MTYRANLEQIRDAILSSLYIGVIEALLRCKTNAQFFMTNYGRTVTALSARRRIELECEAWAEIQKTDHGWEMLNSRAQRALKLQGVTPDAWIVDDGVKKYIASRRESWAYFLHGPEGEKLRAQNQGVGNPQMLDVAANTLIFETKQFQIPNEDDPVNITSRRRTIGEYVVSFPHLDYSACGKYTTSMRDIMIYDEDRDGFSKISLADGLAACMRFDGDTGDLDSHGFSPDLPGVDVDKTDGTDMFFTEDHPHGVDYFAQMKREHMPKAAIRDWVNSVIAQFDDKTRADLVSGLETMYALVEKLEGAPTSYTPEYARYFKFLRDCYINGNGADNLDHKNGVPDLTKIIGQVSDSGEIVVTSALVPYGFATYAGISHMASIAPETLALAADAKVAKKAIDTIRQKMDAVCYGNMFTQLSSVPFYVKDKSTAAAVFSNVLHERLPPLVVEGGMFDLREDESFGGVSAADMETYVTRLVAAFDLAKLSDSGLDDEGKKKSKNLAKKVANEVKQVAMFLSDGPREQLLSILENIRTEIDMEKAYELFMKNMDGHDWYTLTKALAGTESIQDLVDKMQTYKGQFATTGTVAPGVPVTTKTAITPLTCSDEFKKFLISARVSGSFNQYSIRDSGFANIAVGEVGDEEGIERRGGKPGMFGIKRRQSDPDGPAAQHPEVDGWWSSDENSDVRDCIKNVKRDFSSKLERAFALAFVGNAVNGKTLERFISTNCCFPLNVIYARPYQTYSVSTGICMKAGSSSGETLIGHADFQLGDNIIQARALFTYVWLFFTLYLFYFFGRIFFFFFL